MFAPLYLFKLLTAGIIPDQRVFSSARSEATIVPALVQITGLNGVYSPHVHDTSENTNNVAA